MNKCKKCGAEFDGKFCPQCGTPWLAEGEKLCPKCKAVLKANAKFCSECGYSFETPSAPKPVAPQALPVAKQPQKAGKPVAAGTKKRYTAVSVLPAVLFGLFSVLLFFFFLAPVAVMPGGELLGQKIPSTSYGNVYESSNYAGMSFTGCMTALIVFAAFALFITFLILISCVFSNMRGKQFAIAGKKIFLRNIWTAIGYVLFFVLFLVSCILMGQIASDDGGLGLMKAGSAPILVLVFTLICSLAALVCAIAGAHLRKAYPALVAETEEKIAAAKPTKVETWIKKHKAWTAAISAVLVVAIIVGVAVPVGLANRYNGTYYAYNGETEEYDMTRYYELKGDTWKDQNEREGKISFDGEKVTLSYDSSNGMDKTGSSTTTREGTIDGDVLKIGGTVFAKEGHGHMFGDWETIVEPTCITTGKNARTCVCGRSELGRISALGHRYTNHICVRCGQNSNLELEYTLNEEETGYSVTGIGSCTDPDIIIPAEFNNKPVTSIGGSAFKSCSTINTIVIPSSVTSIGSSAFENCSRLESITIPDNVTEIGGGAFGNCKGLTSVTIGSGVKSIGDEAFYECSGLTGELKIPNSVTKIGESAFEGCSGLTSVTIPVSVTSIGESAFEGCSGLTGELKIPNRVTKIGGSAFYKCSGLKCIEIPSSVTSIGSYAFSGCDGLTSVAIPDSVTSIGGSAFSGCSGLKSVTIGSGVTSIGRSAFYGCSGLTSIIIPDSVTGIGASAFAGTAYYENNSNWDAKSVLYVGNHLVCAKNTISGAYTIRGNTKTIAESAFSSCGGLTSVTIGDGVTSIGSGAFTDCSGLESITVDTNNLNYSTQDGILYNKEKTKFVCIPHAIKGAVTIPDGVTLIETESFRSCSGLTSITIPDSVTEIGDDAFRGSIGLTSITIPDSVTEIGVGAFEGCIVLTDIQFEGTVEEWKEMRKWNLWDLYTGDYIVTCTDGTVDKKGNVTYFNN